jgi:surface polysaccharide O-acyltransferase-like enzyme
MNEFPFPKWLCRILSHISAFTIGIYCYNQLTLDKPIELHRWLLTILFGLMFFIGSLPDKK